LGYLWLQTLQVACVQPLLTHPPLVPLFLFLFSFSFIISCIQRYKVTLLSCKKRLLKIISFRIDVARATATTVANRCGPWLNWILG
jgi:hypothetical protein